MANFLVTRDSWLGQRYTACNSAHANSSALSGVLLRSKANFLVTWDSWLGQKGNTACSSARAIIGALSEP